MVSILVILCILSIFFNIKTKDRHLRFSVCCYNFSYILTTVIGVIFLFYTEIGFNLYQIINAGRDHDLIMNFKRYETSFFLMLPSVLLSLIIFVLSKTSFTMIRKKLPTLNLGNTNLLSVCVVVNLIFLYLIYCIIENDLLSNSIYMFTNIGDYHGIINARMNSFSKLSSVYFGMIYVGLPFLSWLCLYKYKLTFCKKWMILLLYTSFIIFIGILATSQKSPIIVYFLILGICYSFLFGVKFKVFILTGSLLFILYTMFMIITVDAWQVFNGFYHVTTRVAKSFPYYFEIYPKYEEYLGINYGLGILGIGVSLNDNLTVFNYMQNDKFKFIEGAVAASLPVRFYAQGGYPLYFLGIFMIFLIILTFSRVFFIFKGDYVFPIFAQGLMTIYYSTQTSFRGITLESYGIIWIFLPITFLIIIDFFLKSNSLPNLNNN